MNVNKDFIRKLFIYSIGSVFSVSALGLEFRPFNEAGERVDDYEERVRSLKPNDTLSFGNNKYRFKILENIYEGKVGIASFKVSAASSETHGEETLIVRLPLGMDDVRLREYVAAHTRFRNLNIEVLDAYSSLDGQFFATKSLDAKTSLRDFLLDQSSYSKEELRKMRSALVAFSGPLAEFDAIAGLTYDNVLYDNKAGKWILADFKSTGHDQKNFGILSNNTLPHPLLIDGVMPQKSLSKSAKVAMFGVRQAIEAGSDEYRSAKVRRLRADLWQNCTRVLKRLLVK